MSEKQSEGGARRISVREANRGFSNLIAQVERGDRFIVTKNNRPVARIEPALDEAAADARRRAAIERLELLMTSGRRSEDGWTYAGRRCELHDRSGG